MPVEPCSTTVEGKSRPGRRFGPEGHCYPCDPDGDCASAESKAKAQGRAIESQKNALRLLRARAHQKGLRRG
jgi:hypothetical protein